MTLRQRFSKDPLKVVRQLDAFPKIPEECQQSTRIGGTRKQNKLQMWNSANANQIPHNIWLCIFFTNFSFCDKPSLDHLSHFQRNNLLHGQQIIV